jgi:hypothetical protein
MTKTKLELEAENAMLKEELKRVQGTAPAEKPKKFVRPDNPGEGGGWLIVGSNQAFFGMRMGIPFKSGHGFVDVEMKDADMIVQRFENDYGYQVTPLDEIALGRTRKRIDSGIGIEKPPQSMGEKLMQPNIVQ